MKDVELVKVYVKQPSSHEFNYQKLDSTEHHIKRYENT